MSTDFVTHDVGHRTTPLSPEVTVEIVLDGKLFNGKPFVLPPCPKHGEGFVCQHEADVDYEDEFV